MTPVLGIDLGTTNSSCALWDGRDVVVVPNQRGSRTTPSVVSVLDDGSLVCGEAARNQAALRPERSLRWVKRRMGTDEILDLGGRHIGAEEASAAILRSLKGDAEAYFGQELPEAVITVPAYFSEPQRRATRAAGELAGFVVRRLINEPTAAALAFAWARNRAFGEETEERLELVYDLGGGTFDVTALAVRGRECRVLSACGDNRLGGADFDEQLFRVALESFESQLGAGAVSEDPFLRYQLLDLAERAKIELSSADSASLVLPFAGRSGRGHPAVTVTRDEFEGLIAPAIDRTIALVAQALDEAGRRPDEVDRLILSGGSSRIPLVRRALAEFLGRGGESRVNPEEIVAVGAAVYANLADGAEDGVSVEDAVSQPFGVEIDGDEFAVVVPKNTPIPARRRRLFTTVSDRQSSVEIHILQGSSSSASGNTSLGRFLLSGIRAGARGEPRIEVEFLVDDDGILHVKALDVDTNASQELTVAAVLDGSSADPERLRRLVGRLASLTDRGIRDSALDAEVEEGIATAQRAAEIPDPDGWAKAAIVLEALIAEVESRRTELS